MSERKRTIEDMRPLLVSLITGIDESLKSRRLKWICVCGLPSNFSLLSTYKRALLIRQQIKSQVGGELLDWTEIVHIDHPVGDNQAIVLLYDRHFPIVPESEQLPEYNHAIDKPMVENAMEEGKIKSKEAVDKLKAEADARARGEHLRPRVDVPEVDMKAEVDETESPNAEEIKSQATNWMLESRQLKVVVIGERFLEMCPRVEENTENEWLFFHVRQKVGGLPADVEIAGVKHDDMNRCARITIWSRSFPVVPVTEEIPGFGEEVEVEGTENENRLFTKGERVYTPDGPGSVIEYPVTDCTMIDVQLETSEDGVDNELRYPVNVVETEEEKIVNEAYENQRQSRKQSASPDPCEDCDDDYSNTCEHCDRDAEEEISFGQKILERLANFNEKLDRIDKFSDTLIDVSSFRPRDKVIAEGRAMEIESVRMFMVGVNGSISCTIMMKKPISQENKYG